MQKKRNPRLLSDFADKPPSTEPPSGSLFQKLVDNPESVAISNMCYNTDYIQGIREGTLDANIYGNFNVSDAYYCYAGAKDYEEAAKRAHDEPELMGYLAEKARSYQKYTTTASRRHLASHGGPSPYFLPKRPRRIQTGRQTSRRTKTLSTR